MASPAGRRAQKNGTLSDTVMVLVETKRIELSTSCMRSKRSPS